MTGEPKRWGQHLTPDERVLAALFFDGGEPEDVPWIVLITDHGNDGHLTVYGSYETELAALTVRDRIATDMFEEFRDEILVTHHRLYPDEHEEAL